MERHRASSRPRKVRFRASQPHTLTMFPSTLLAIASAAVVSAHTVITYPGWRGNNLVTNHTFPYGMQWMYPCEFSQLRTSPPHKALELTTISRWRHASDTEQDVLVNTRRRHRLPTRLVPRPRHSIRLHEHRLWKRRPRRKPPTWRPAKHEQPHDRALSAPRPQQEPLPRHLLPPAGAPARKHDRESRRQRHDPARRASPPRRSPLLRTSPSLLFPPQKEPVTLTYSAPQNSASTSPSSSPATRASPRSTRPTASTAPTLASPTSTPSPCAPRGQTMPRAGRHARWP